MHSSSDVRSCVGNRDIGGESDERWIERDRGEAENGEQIERKRHSRDGGQGTVRRDIERETHERRREETEGNR